MMGVPVQAGFAWAGVFLSTSSTGAPSGRLQYGVGDDNKWRGARPNSPTQPKDGWVGHPAVDISQLLDTLARRPHVEVIIPRLPKVFVVADQLARDRLLDGLYRAGQRAALRFAHQQMHVFGHHHVTGDIESVANSAPFQRAFKQMHRLPARKQRLAPIATERNKV